MFFFYFCGINLNVVARDFMLRGEKEECRKKGNSLEELCHKQEKKKKKIQSIHLRLVLHSSPPPPPLCCSSLFPRLWVHSQCSAVEKPVLTVLCFPIQLHCFACGDPEVWLSCAEATLWLRYRMGAEHQGELLYLLCKSSKQQRLCVFGLNV